MKIIITKSIIASGAKSIASSTAAMADSFHKDIHDKNSFKEMVNMTPEDIKVRNITRKWGSLCEVDDDIHLEINDTFIIKLIGAYEGAITKFAPIAGVFYGMIPLLKSYIKDLKGIFTKLGEEYAEEYEYAVQNVTFPGVKDCRIIISRIKGDSSWSFHAMYTCFTDEFMSMDCNVRNAMKRQIENMTMKSVNSEDATTPTTIFTNIEDAKAYAEGKLKVQNDATNMGAVDDQNNDDLKVKTYDVPPQDANTMGGFDNLMFT